MKFLNKPLKIFVVFVLVVLGTWAIFAAVAPAPSSVAHERAVRRAVLSAGGDTQAEPGAGLSASPVVEAVEVNLADLKFEVVDSMYDKWLRGELDMDELEGRVSRAERNALIEAALNMGPQDGNVLSADEDPGQYAPPTQLTGFAAISIDDCYPTGASIPPDSDMAAGPSHLIAVSNSCFIIYNKTGTVLLGPIQFDTVFGVSGTFDPTVLYDQETDRFVMNIEDGYYNYLMVSQTSDPTGSWWTYSWDARPVGTEFYDYPHIGIGDHAIFIGANLFDDSSGSWIGGEAYAVDKNVAYAGGSLTVYFASLTANGGTPQPLNLTGFAQGTVPQPFDTHYFITDPYDGSTADLWAWPNALSGGSPSIVATYDIGTATGASGMPISVAQLGSTDTIQGNDWRWRGFEYRNGYGWSTDSVSYDFGSGTVDVFRYFRMDFSDYSLTQAVGYGYFTSNLIFPDLAVDHCNNMAVGVERGDSSMYPSVEWTGVTAGTTSPTTPSRLKTGETFDYAWYTGDLRYGDYSGMAIDPDGKTFWYMGEYPLSSVSNLYTNWGNYIGSFTYNCNVGGSPPPADFDGDGDTDISVFRPSTGRWYIKDQTAFNYGQSGDVPVPGDYDGDGAVDAAIFRPSNGRWYIYGGSAFNYGQSGDIPVPGDYDGDGDTDAAIFRPSNGRWYIYGGSAFNYGQSGDIPVPGDYDGDGDTDAAIFRPSNGRWYIYGGSSYTYGTQSGDIPVPGDYDGDGDIDIAIYRPSNGNWYILGGTSTTYGQSSDFPLPARDTNGDGDPYQ